MMISMQSTLSSFAPATERQQRSARRRKWLFKIVVLLLGLYLGLCALLAWETVRAKPQSMARKPLDLRCEEIGFASADGTRLRGWFVPAEGQAAGVVVCCHGVDSTRWAMVRAAHILHNAGFAVVLFDFRARGASGGTRCTLGYRETDDLLAAIAYAQHRPDLRGVPLGVLGESMGGAVALMGTARDRSVRCVVAESPFARLDHAVSNHFRMMLNAFGPVLGVPTRWIGECLIGVHCRDVAPIREIGKIAPRPLLLIEDEADRLCPKTETQSLFATAGAPKEIWAVPGADHISARVVQPDEYARRLTAFFAANLAHNNGATPQSIR